MNKIVSKENQKKLIIMIVIIMLFNFVMPNYSFALTGGGGVIFKYLVPIILMIPDLLLNKLQNIFIGDEADIGQEDPKGGISHYLIMYSPGAIFSGQIAGLDVNFMSPLTTYDPNTGKPKYGEGQVETKWDKYKYTPVTELEDGTSKDEFDLEDLEKYFNFDKEKAVTNITNSDTSTYVIWFRKRSY